jgi:hypothetical protein
MEEKKTVRYIYLSAAFAAILLGLLIFLRFFLPSNILESVLSFQIKHPEPFDSRVNNAIFSVFIASLIVFLFLLGNKYLKFNPLKKYLPNIADFFSKVLTLRLVLVTVIVYLAALFCLAISRFDLGVDEVGYLIYAGNFFKTGYAYCILNGKFFMLDNYAMLPMYLFSTVNFLFGLTDVWHFKLLASLLSICSIIIISRIASKLYNTKTAILFLFFLVVQPGFGFVASSFFGEIVQAAFFFTAVYIWLKDDSSLNAKKIFVISLLFALSIQTKFQLSQITLLTLLVFHFVDNRKKALSILFFTLAIAVSLAIIRTIPAAISDKTNIIMYLRFWAGQLWGNPERDLLFFIDRTHFFNRFLPVIFLTLILGAVFIWAEKPHEKFLSLFTLFYFLWWIFYFRLSNYRVLFIGIITLCFLLAAFVYDYYSKILEEGKKSQRTLALISAVCVFVIASYGFTENLIYAFIGNNDAVQFDLDESKSRLFTPVKWDNSQKEFYREAKKILQNVDSVYITLGGQASFIPQFYLGENRIYDYPYLAESLQKSPGIKYVIIDRTAYPLGLEEGYKKVDSLDVKRELLLKKGEYELYSVTK